MSALLGFAGPHLLNVIGPLIIWLIKKQDSPYLDALGKRVLNFQLSYSLYGFAAITLYWPALVAGDWVYFSSPSTPIIGVAWLILTIIGAVKESNGETYEYPLRHQVPPLSLSRSRSDRLVTASRELCVLTAAPSLILPRFAVNCP